MRSTQFKNLNTYIRNRYSSVGSFESNNSIAKNSVRRLLDKKTENVTIRTLIHLADTMNCTVDEILDRHNFIQPGQSFFDDENLSNELVQQIFEFMAHTLKANKEVAEINKKELFKVISQILNYSAEKNNNKFDPKVTSWILEHSILQK